MKARGKKIKFYKVATQWIEENLEHVNYFAFLSKPNQPLSRLAANAELKNNSIL